MRVIMLLTIIAALNVSAIADTTGKPLCDCFGRVVDETLMGDTVTIYTNNNKIISGIHPVTVTSSTLYGRSLVEQGTAETINIRLEDIDRITYSTPNKAAKILPLIGLAAGSIGGAALGSTLPQNDPSCWIIDPNVLLGGAIGGILGIALGHEIEKHINIRVNLQCR